MAHGDYTAAADILNGMSLQGPELALCPLQPRRCPAQAQRHAAQRRPRHGDPRRPRPHAGRDEEFRSLRDRANVALGFTALTEGDPKAARSYLERVRLKSLQSNKALLGFGWAADLAQGSQARARALARAGRPRRRRFRRPRGAHRRALRLRQARRLRPGARPLQRRDRGVRGGEQGASRSRSPRCARRSGSTP